MKDVVNEYRAKGIRKAEFCRSQNIGISKFNYWLKVYSPIKLEAGSFVKLLGHDLRSPVRVYLTNGIELEYLESLPNNVLEKLLSYVGE